MKRPPSAKKGECYAVFVLLFGVNSLSKVSQLVWGKAGMGMRALTLSLSPPRSRAVLLAGGGAW